MSGSSSFSSTMTRFMRFGTKYGEPTCGSEIWAMVTTQPVYVQSGPVGSETTIVPSPIVVRYAVTVPETEGVTASCTAARAVSARLAPLHAVDLLDLILLIVLMIAAVNGYR